MKPSRRMLPPVLCAAFFIAAAVLALAAERIPPSARPRPRAADGDILEVMFGGARDAFSDAMVRKADVYFHGGVEAECRCHDGTEDVHDADAPRAEPDFLSAPFRWIDSRVHSRDHRHLAGTDAREMMPFLWAAVRANRSNVAAWAEAAYAAAAMMKDCPLALRILDEGLAENPGCVELARDRAHILHHRVGDTSAAEREFERILAMSAGAGDDATVRIRIDAMMHLAKAADGRGDSASVIRFADEAARLMPECAATKWIQELAEKHRNPEIREHEQEQERKE